MRNHLLKNLQGEPSSLYAVFNSGYLSVFKVLFQVGVHIHIVVHINSNPTHEKKIKNIKYIVFLLKSAYCTL